MTFFFEDDLHLVKNKNTLKQHQQKQKIGNNKKMKMPTRDDKMTTNNNKVLKKHNENIMCIRLDMVF
jgi:hypothetical protein